MELRKLGISRNSFFTDCKPICEKGVFCFIGRIFVLKCVDFPN